MKKILSVLLSSLTLTALPFVASKCHNEEQPKPNPNPSDKKQSYKYIQQLGFFLIENTVQKLIGGTSEFDVKPLAEDLEIGRNAISKYAVKDYEKLLKEGKKVKLSKNGDECKKMLEKLEKAKTKLLGEVVVGTKPRDPYILKYQADNYYASLEGKKGDELINALIELQKEARKGITLYHDGYQALYNTYHEAFLDKYYEKDDSYIDIYTENPYGEDPFTYWDMKHDNWNVEGGFLAREHMVPKSWFDISKVIAGQDPKSVPMYNDAHHVWPGDGLVNGKHSNFPYGEIKKRATFVSTMGTKIGASKEDNALVCEPIFEFKGDIARAYLYFSLTYRDYKLNISAGVRVFDDKGLINSKYLPTYLRWAKADQVSAFDVGRNNGIAKHQKIRNPFTDYPELIDVVFGGNKDYVFHNKGITIL
ncbi:endonuclease I [Metamycoplasma subdolum]|uniref:Endonuclease I n=1 Tax=Metamycoplasma subdolum TaxID=92407 RepID=A0A3M0A424_9BACT|nr:endonuclease [Metamycoplasma subdolum]RMA77488.1 endonuclease I [Metamycoplasma subdolum]WPB50686.1 endonuclease [Metamycoplasma subdolum]